MSLKGCQDLLDCVPGRGHAPGLAAPPRGPADTRTGRLRNLSARSGAKTSKAEDLSCKSTPAAFAAGSTCLTPADQEPELQVFSNIWQDPEELISWSCAEGWTLTFSVSPQPSSVWC